MGSGAVNIGSGLERKKWLYEGLIQKASTSFWAPYTGMTSESIIYQTNNESAADGHTVVFDFSGKISGKAIKGKDTAYGKGEIKRKFSDKITVERYRIPVDNGDKFDGKNIGDLSINEHEDSRSKLADLFIRWKDQMIFDALQGALGSSPSHIYSLTQFGYSELLDIEDALKTGKGFKAGSATGAVTTTAAGRRGPLEPFKLMDGEPVWLFVVDSYMATSLKKSADYQSLVLHGDVRGNENRAIKGVIGKIGRLLIVEASDFFGFTEGTGAFGLDDSEVEICGLRKYAAGAAGASTALEGWEGQAAYDAGTNFYSRGLILGQGACQTAFGKMPDYKFQESQDFGITSESAVEFWTEAKKTNLKLEGGNVYKAAKISGLDYGVVAVDLLHA